MPKQPPKAQYHVPPPKQQTTPSSASGSGYSAFQWQAAGTVGPKAEPQKCAGPVPDMEAKLPSFYDPYYTISENKYLNGTRGIGSTLRRHCLLTIRCELRGRLDPRLKRILRSSGRAALPYQQYLMRRRTILQLGMEEEPMPRCIVFSLMNHLHPFKRPMTVPGLWDRRRRRLKPERKIK